MEWIDSSSESVADVLSAISSNCHPKYPYMLTQNGREELNDLFEKNLNLGANMEPLLLQWLKNSVASFILSIARLIFYNE